MGKSQCFQQRVLKKTLNVNLPKDEVGPLPNTIYKINSKCIKDLELILTPVRKHRAKVRNTGFGNHFLDMTPKARATNNKL